MSVQRNGKTWRVRWREGGVQKSRTFDRKGDAVMFDAAVRRRLQLGRAMPGWLLADAITTRLEDYRRQLPDPPADPLAYLRDPSPVDVQDAVLFARIAELEWVARQLADGRVTV